MTTSPDEGDQIAVTVVSRAQAAEDGWHVVDTQGRRWFLQQTALDATLLTLHAGQRLTATCGEDGRVSHARL